MRTSPHGPGLSSGTSYPSTSNPAVDQPPPNGMTVVAPTDWTPGTARSAGITRSKKAICCGFSA
jgi:hypothetical protein